MAHLVETMAYAGETPWHGIGVRVPADLAPQQMLKAAGLDWQVNRIPTYITVGGTQIPTGTTALVRNTDSRILDVVSNDWIPVQNTDAFDFFHEYCQLGDMEMHTAGSLRDGQVVWALAKIKESFELFKGDVVESYLLFTNPHRFGQSVDVRFTPIRVVCNNTMTMALRQYSENSVRRTHRTEFDADAVKRELGIAVTHLQRYKEQAQFLGSKKFTNETVTEYFKRIFPVLAVDKAKGPQRKELSKSATRALEVMHTQPGAEYAEGSWWQALNTVTYMVDHELGRTAPMRLHSAWYGTGKKTKAMALETALEAAEMA